MFFSQETSTDISNLTAAQTCIKAPSIWPMSIAGLSDLPTSITISVLNTCVYRQKQADA